MYFISGLSKSRKKRDFTFIVIDKFSKTTHFISCRKNKDATNLTDIFFKKVVQLHSILRSIMSNQNIKFFSYFLQVFYGVSYKPNFYFLVLVIHKQMIKLKY